MERSGLPLRATRGGRRPGSDQVLAVARLQGKFHNVPAFLLPRLAEMATEVPNTQTGLRIYYERVHCLIMLAYVARRTDPASFRLDEPPANAERDFGRALGQAFHQGCSLADIALATGLPPDRVVATGKRTIRRTKWLSRIAADPDLA